MAALCGQLWCMVVCMLLTGCARQYESIVSSKPSSAGASDVKLGGLP